MQETQKKKIQITATDRKIVVSIAICYITAEGMSLLEFVFTYEGTELEIIQRMTSAIACLLVWRLLFWIRQSSYGAFVSVLIMWIFGYFVSKRKGVDSQAEQG